MSAADRLGLGELCFNSSKEMGVDLIKVVSGGITIEMGVGSGPYLGLITLTQARYHGSE